MLWETCWLSRPVGEWILQEKCQDLMATVIVLPGDTYMGQSSVIQQAIQSADHCLTIFGVLCLFNYRCRCPRWFGLCDLRDGLSELMVRANLVLWPFSGYLEQLLLHCSSRCHDY